MIGTSAGEITAENVVVATGTNPVPYIPAFASVLAKGMFQDHSAFYRNPDALPPGNVLVAGAGTSGTEIAPELSNTRKPIFSVNLLFIFLTTFSGMAENCSGGL